MNLRQIAIPDRMKDLPLDDRGFPITFTTTIGPDGKPDFRVPDAGKWALMCHGKLCAVCGQQLDYWIFFIGGEELFVDRLFFEGPMHRECAEYSIKVCPFLAISSARRSARDFTGDAAFLNDLPIGQQRPARLGLGRTRDFKMVQVDITDQMRNGPLSYVLATGSLKVMLIKPDTFKEITWFTSADDLFPGDSIGAKESDEQTEI